MLRYVILFLGLTMLALLVFQALTGARVIRLAGRTHWRVHRGVGYAAVGVALVHATLAVGFLFFGWY
jgi:inner membrane protein involved in colicin E2 resistance